MSATSSPVSIDSSSCPMADSCSTSTTSFSSPCSSPSFHYSLLNRYGPCLVSYWVNAHFYADGTQACDNTPPSGLVTEHGDAARDSHADSESDYTQRPLDFFPLPGTVPTPRIKQSEDDVDYWDSISAVSYGRLHARARRDLQVLDRERKVKAAARAKIDNEEEESDASDEEETYFLVRLNENTAILVDPFGDCPQYRMLNYPPTEHQRSVMRALWGEEQAGYLFDGQFGFDNACTFFAHSGCAYRRWLLTLYAYYRVKQQQKHRAAAKRSAVEVTTDNCSYYSSQPKEACAEAGLRSRGVKQGDDCYQRDNVKRRCVR